MNLIRVAVVALATLASTSLAQQDENLRGAMKSSSVYDIESAVLVAEDDSLEVCTVSWISPCS